MGERRPLHEVIAQLKRTPKLHQLSVLCLDGATRKILVGAQRQKWQALGKVLEALEWECIEGTDKDGAVLVVIGEEIEDEADDGAGSKMIRAQGSLVKIMLEAQDVALKRQGEHLGRLLDGCVQLTETLTKRIISLENMYAANLRLVQDVVGTSGDEDEGSNMTAKLLEVFGPELLRRYMAKKGNGGAPTVDT